MPSILLALTHPSKEFFKRQRALLQKNVPVGFPSLSDDYVQQRINLDEQLIKHRESTFYKCVAGYSMRGMGILDGDLRW